MKPISHLLCMALLTACPGLSSADGPVSDPIQAHLFEPELLMQHQVEIGLTDQQIKKIQALVEKAGPKIQQYQRQRDDAMNKLAQLLAVAKVDENAALKQLDAVLAIEKELTHIHFRVMIQIRNELNAEQQGIAAKLKQRPQNTNILEQRLKAKVTRIEKEIQLQFQAAGPPQDVLDLLQRFSSLMESGHVEEAEAVLDHLLETLGVKDADDAADSAARADAGEQSSLAPPATGKVAATSEEPKYLIFWSAPENAGELAQQIGMKGDGKTRLLGFGLPNPTFEIEEQLPNRIRSAFAAARRHDMAVMLHFDFHLAWKNRPDLWNWFDPGKPGYDPNNRYNVEWHGWDGPPNKVRYLNHGVLERLPPNMCFTSKRTRAEITRIVSKVIGPVLREEIAKLKADDKEALFAGVLVGLEPSIDDYSQPNSERTMMMKEDGVPAEPLGYRALLDRGFSADNPPDDFRQALAKIVQETVAFWCGQFVDAGIPAQKLYPHVAAPAPIEVMNAPIWTAFNEYSRPGWTTYAVMLLEENFQPIYDELEQHGNPAWAGVEANAGMPGSFVDWETYLGWHYNHGCVLVGVNDGATGEDLPKRLRESAFSEEAIAAYRKFLTGQPLLEKAVSVDRPQFRIQTKMKRVQEGIQRWHSTGKDPSAVGKLMEGAQPLADGGKLDALEKLVDQALEMLGEAGKSPDVYGQE